jgi:hypothetical protein
MIKKYVPGSIEISEEIYQELASKHGQKVNTWLSAKCPAHDDQKASLGLLITREQGHLKLAVHCHASCEPGKIYEAMGIQQYPVIHENYWDYLKTDGRYSHTKLKKEIFIGDNRASKRYSIGIRKSNSFNDYDFDKVFKKTEDILYNLPQVLKETDDIYIVEGEKCADAIIELGLTATTACKGGGFWDSKFVESISHAKRIIIIPDNDDTGVLYLHKISKSLLDKGYEEVYRLNLPGLDIKEDIYDWFQKGNTIDDLKALPLEKINRGEIPENIANGISSSFNEFNVEIPPEVEALFKDLESYVYLEEHGRDVLTQIVKDSVNGVSLSKTTPDALKKGFYAGYKVIIHGENNNGKFTKRLVNIIDYWNQWNLYKHNRGPKTYKKIEFDPRPVPEAGIYNLYTGFELEPVFDENVDGFLQFLSENICSGDREAYEFFLDFHAHLFQHPEVLPFVALVLRGEKRSGKSGIVDLMMRIIGRRYCAVVNHWEQVVGRFNNHLIGRLLIAIDDATWGGYKEKVGFLNNLITGYRLCMEAKGRDLVNVNNYARVVIIGNDSWLVPKTKDDGRFFVIDVPPRSKSDEFYKTFFETWQKPENLAKLLGYLLKREVSKWRPIDTVINRTVGHDMSLESLSLLEKFIFNCASRKSLIYKPRPGSSSGVNMAQILEMRNEMTWPEKIDIRKVRESYRDWCDDHRHVDDCDETRFSKCSGLKSKRAGTAINAFSGPH